MIARARKIQRRAKVQAALERALEQDVRLVFDRIADRAAGSVTASQTDAAVNAETPLLLRRLMTRNMETARTFIRMTLMDVKGEAGLLETKRINLLEIVENTVWSWLETYALSRVRQIANYTKEILRNALQESYDNGDGEQATARRLREAVSGDIGRRRAATIARTETLIATNKASDEAARATGLRMVKEWGATEDARTRPDHAAADGQTREMDEDFDVGGEKMSYPGDTKGSAKQVINCRCVVLYRPIRPDSPTSSSAPAQEPIAAEFE